MRRARTAIVVLALLAASCAADSTEGKFGEELYEAACAACHRSSGEGGSGFPAIGSGSDAASLTDDQLAGVIRVGPGAMPAFSRFSDEQIDSVVAYVRQLQGDG